MQIARFIRQLQWYGYTKSDYDRCRHNIAASNVRLLKSVVILSVGLMGMLFFFSFFMGVIERFHWVYASYFLL